MPRRLHIKNMLTRSLSVLRGRKEDPVDIPARSARTVDGSLADSPHYKQLIRKGYLRLIRDYEIPDVAKKPKAPSLSSTSSTSSRSPKQSKKTKEKPKGFQSSKTDEDPVSPAPKEGRE